MPASRPAALAEATRPARTHRRAGDTRTQRERGYDAGFVAERKRWQARLNTGALILCWRPKCRRRIDRERWHLGHDDHDRTLIRGPECPPCNLAAAARKANAQRRAQRARQPRSRDW